MVWWLYVYKSGSEIMSDQRPLKVKDNIGWTKCDLEIRFPKGSIEHLLGRKLTWEDEPVLFQTGHYDKNE